MQHYRATFYVYCKSAFEIVTTNQTLCDRCGTLTTEMSSRYYSTVLKLLHLRWLDVANRRHNFLNVGYVKS